MDRGDRLADSVCIALIVATIGSFTSPPLANVAAALALILALASVPMRARLVWVARQPLGLGALGLFATMTAAMLWADVPWHQRFDAWWNWRVMLLLVLTAAAFGPPRWKLRFCASLVAVLTVGAIVSFAMGRAKATMEPGFAGILFRNHVTQSMAMAVGAVLAAALASQAARGARSRLVLAAAATACVANVVFVSSGRSGQVALVIAAFASALLLLRGRQRWFALVAVPVVAAALVLATPMLQRRFTMVSDEASAIDCSREETSTGLRLLLWHTTGNLILSRPGLGYGVGGFSGAYEKQVRQQMQGHEGSGWCIRPAHDPHNQFLRVTVEAGVLGLLAFLGLIAGAARQRAAQPYRACALALLAAWCVTSLFNSHFQTFNEGHLIALLLGALLAPDAQEASAANTAAYTSS
jgi:O-antigen ligase